MTEKKKWQRRGSMSAGGASSGIYGLGFIGALVYYLQRADSFWMVILGILKACTWPAFLIYKLFQFLKM